MSEITEVRVPRAGEWIRVNPNPASRDEVTLTRDEQGQYYMVVPELVPDLMKLAPERIQRAMIFMAQNREGETFLWPVTLPVSEAHLAYRAMEEWVCFPLMQ
jgi:hypothetical protein